MQDYKTGFGQSQHFILGNFTKTIFIFFVFTPCTFIFIANFVG